MVRLFFLIFKNLSKNLLIITRKKYSQLRRLFFKQPTHNKKNGHIKVYNESGKGFMSYVERLEEYLKVNNIKDSRKY